MTDLGLSGGSPQPTYSWTQPCCVACWNERNPDRQAVALKQAETERCVYCGSWDQSGTYVRIDPADAPYPTLEKN